VRAFAIGIQLPLIGRRCYLSTGSHSKKNIGFLLDLLVIARRVIPDLLLMIAGEGPARHWLEKRAAQLGVGGNVLFVGYLSRRDSLLDCYCAADAFVFASRTETQGLVLFEAMALGTPLVSTAVMGNCCHTPPEQAT
jgi:glycosyltransferase involved in cell wall biosynthesis